MKQYSVCMFRNVQHLATFSHWIVFGIVAIVLITIYPKIVYGSTVIEDRLITGTETWKASGGPYRISGTVHIPKNAKLTIETGSRLYFDSGKIQVEGELVLTSALQSTEVETVVITSPLFAGIDVVGGSVKIEGLRFEPEFGVSNNESVTESTPCPKIQIWSHGTGTVVRSSFIQCSSNAPIVTVWGGGLLSIDTSMFTRVRSGSVVDVFGESNLTVTHSVFKNAGRVSAVSVFGIGTNSLFEDNTFSEQKVGIQVFDKALFVSNSNSFNKSTTGISIFTQAVSEITQNIFEDNQIGIEAYTGSTTISESIFERNTEYGALVSQGIFYAVKNWWGNMTGPTYIQNPTGTGEAVEGDLSVYPWLTEKPNLSPCCSSVVFIPGIQGSRLYTRGFLFENQLWEPNRDADVKKLYLNSDGTSKNKIYTRDIISRTNLGSSLGIGFLDSNIYAELVELLDSLKKKKSITDWQAFPYDWRADSYTVFESNKQEWILKIKQMAKVSKTGKVTFVAHSFGGFVLQRFVDELVKEGYGKYIDSVVYIAVPQFGSFESVLSVLHGDNQDLLHGAILTGATARGLSKNSPATYELFPKWSQSDAQVPTIQASSTGGVNQSESGQSISNQFGLVSDVVNISGVPYLKISDITTKNNPTPQINSSQFSQLFDFIFKKNTFSQRAVPFNEIDIQSPAVGNENIFRDVLLRQKQRKIDSEVASVNNNGTNPKLFKSFSILGIGALTALGLEYIKSCTPSVSTLALPSPVISGDLAKDLYCSNKRKLLYFTLGDGVVPIGDLSRRSGIKALVDISQYEKIHSIQISHAQFAASEPVLTMLRQIIFNKSLSLAGAPYIQIVGENNSSNDSTGDEQNMGNSTENQGDTVSKGAYHRIEITTPGNLKLKTNSGTLEEYAIGTGVTYKNTIPNIRYEKIADTRFLLIPKSVQIQTVQVDSKKFGVQSVIIDTIDHSQSTQYIGGSLSNPVYIFNTIPATPTTVAIVQFSTTAASTSTSPQVPVLLVTDQTNSEGNQQAGGLIGTVVSSPIVASSSYSVVENPEYTIEQIKAELRKINSEIKASVLPKKFIDRYSLKTEAILRKIDSYPPTKPKEYTRVIQKSLAAIVTEIEEYGNRYYKDRMTVGETSFLYIKFFKVYTMFLYLKAS